MVQRTATDIEGDGISAPARVPAADRRSAEYKLQQDYDTTEHPDPDPEPPALPTVSDEFKFTAEQIEAARKQERDKVHTRLAQEKAARAEQAKELEELRQWRLAQQEEAAAKQRADDRKAKKEAEKDLSAKERLEILEAEIEKREAENQAKLDARLAAIESERVQERAQLKLEREFLTLQNYITTRVGEELNAKTLAPQFVDFITGTSTDEVDAAIDLAKVKTAEILAEVAGQQAAPQSRGVSTHTGPSSMGSVTEVEGEPVDYTKMSFKEFVQNRQKLISGSEPDRGIFS